MLAVFAILGVSGIFFQAWSDIPFIDPCQASLAEFLSFKIPT